LLCAQGGETATPTALSTDFLEAIGSSLNGWLPPGLGDKERHAACAPASTDVGRN